MLEDRYARGVAVLEAMGNDPAVLSAWQRVHPIVGPKLDRMLGEFCFGDVWADDGLDLRTRRIVTLVSIAVLGRNQTLAGHIRLALEQGFERREILELFVHLIPYAGFPVALTAIQTADEVFSEIDDEKGEGLIR